MMFLQNHLMILNMLQLMLLILYAFIKKLLKKNNFKKIYLISEDRLNPIIDILLNNYTNTIYNKN